MNYETDIVVVNDIIFTTLVAITAADHSRGLMFKKWPPPIMCFPYKNSMVRKFWMHQTCSPLDIVFCNNNKIISICEGTPYSTRMIGPNIPSDLVVEFPKGTMEHLNIKIGDNVRLMPTFKTVSAMAVTGFNFVSNA